MLYGECFIKSGKEGEKQTGRNKEKTELEKRSEKDEERWQENAVSHPELRLVLIGRTGSGKSASGNTILGRQHFLSELRASSVTQVCQRGSADLPEGEKEEQWGKDQFRRKRRVLVVDMPGFGDTRMDPAQLYGEIAKCVTLSSPGPHAFLLVTPLGRYSEDEGRAAREVARVFGEAALQHHTMVLFTRGDELEHEGITAEQFLGGAAPTGLRALLQTCGGRYHVLNNRDSGNRGQVQELMEKVERMVEENEGQCYTSAMFQQAELAIQEEQERLMRERGEELEEEGGDDDEGMTLAKRRRRKGGRWEEGEMLSPSAEEKGVGLTRRDERTSEGWGLLQERGQRWRERERRRAGGGRRQSLRSAVSRFRREAALSQKVLERVKALVAAGATGMAVGAVFGAAAPLAVAAGATVMGSSVGLAAGQLAGGCAVGCAGMGKALGAIVTAAAGKTALAVGAATGGVLGGSVGLVAGAEAAGPREAALEALGQVGMMGATVVGVAAGVGGALGAGTAIGAVIEGGAVSAAALTGAETVAGVATVSGANPTALAVSSVAGTGQAVGCGVAEGAAAACGSQSAVATTHGLTGALETAGATARIITTVTEIGKAAMGIVLAGGLVVKVVKEKVRSATGSAESGYTERSAYEIYWNK